MKQACIILFTQADINECQLKRFLTLYKKNIFTKIFKSLQWHIFLKFSWAKCVYYKLVDIHYELIKLFDELLGYYDN